MVQLTVSLTHQIAVNSREFSDSIGGYVLKIVNKENSIITSPMVNSASYSGGVAYIDFGYQTKEGSSYYCIFSVDGVEVFKTMMFATDQTTKTPYQNITINNDIV